MPTKSGAIHCPSSCLMRISSAFSHAGNWSMASKSSPDQQVSLTPTFFRETLDGLSDGLIAFAEHPLGLLQQDRGPKKGLTNESPSVRSWKLLPRRPASDRLAWMSRSARLKSLTSGRPSSRPGLICTDARSERRRSICCAGWRGSDRAGRVMQMQVRLHACPRTFGV